MTQKPRILFVDDEELLLEAMQRAFLRHRRMDWDMTFECHPKKAVQLHMEKPFDVVVTDYHMPEMNGIEVATKIHEIQPITQVMMLTGAADLDTAANVINSTEIFRFYTKPCPSDDLENGIESCLERFVEKQEKQAPSPQYGRNVLDRLPVGVIICEKNGHVIHMNQYGAELCARKTVLSIDQSNVLRTVNSAERQELENCIASDTTGDRALSLLPEDSDTPVSVIVSGFNGEMNEKVMLLISDPEQHIAPSAEILQSIYDLPPSEANLLHHLVQGYSLKEAAKQIEITESSARTYLKRIFSKTNTSGQPELIRSVLLTPSLQPAENG